MQDTRTWSSSEKTALVLLLLSDLTYPQIALRLGRSEAAVKLKANELAKKDSTFRRYRKHGHGRSQAEWMREKREGERSLREAVRRKNVTEDPALLEQYCAVPEEDQ